MKHRLSITLLLLCMFLATQAIGLVVLNLYAPTTTLVVNEETGEEELITEREKLPFGMEYEEEQSLASTAITLITSLILAILLYGFLMRHDMRIVIRVWFMLVVFIAIGITVHPIVSRYTTYPGIITSLLVLPLVYYKIIRPNVYVHNITELIIYPGIAVVLVALIYMPTNAVASIAVVLSLLVIIALYDAWAVWKSGIMQKMAQYQMEQLNIFGGFLIPTLSKKDKATLNAIKAQYKDTKTRREKLKKKKIKVNVAILGGGDVIFPIITAGVFMWTYPKQALFGVAGLIPALFIIAGALTGLTYLFMNTQKGKAYPAMPYISTGIIVSVLLWKLII